MTEHYCYYIIFKCTRKQFNNFYSCCSLRNNRQYLLRGYPEIISMSQDLRLTRATSAFSRVSPSGTLPGSDNMAGDGAGLRAKGRAEGSLEHVVWVSHRIRRDWSFTKAWSRSRDRWLSRQNLDEKITELKNIKTVAAFNEEARKWKILLLLGPLL